MTHLAEAPVAEVSVPRMELAEWWERFHVVAGITTRGPTGTECDLRLDEPVGASASWLAFQTAFSPRFPRMAVGRQVHGNQIHIHAPGEGEVARGLQVYPGVDGHLTDRQGCLLAVTVADCIPIYLVAPGTRTVALLHAGWRGIAAGILERGVAMFVAHGSPPADLVAHLGVGVCGACYQVGPEVPDQLGLPRPAGPITLDLRETLANRARNLGISQVTVSPGCSRHDADFHSYRRDGDRAGRMVAYLGLPLG